MIQEILITIKIPVLIIIFICYFFFRYKFNRFKNDIGIKTNLFVLKNALNKTDDNLIKSKIENIILLKKIDVFISFFGIIFFFVLIYYHAF